MRVAERILRRVFAAVRTPIRFRLWDGTVVDVGPAESRFAIVFRSPGVFRRILRDPTPLRFGEAYIAGEIDIEGDILDAMRVADDIEHVRVPLSTRVAAFAELLRV
jgi:cyclopropane-fatty-acyl-phospholipid synthase